MGSARLHLWVHDERFSKQDLVIHPDCLPFVLPGDILEIFHPGSEVGKMKQVCLMSANTSPTHSHLPDVESSKKLMIEVKGLELELLSKQPNLQISIAQHIAAIFELQPRTDVIVRKVDPENITADYVEFVFRDQYVGRAHMWHLKTHVTSSCVYKGKKFTTLGIRAQVKDVVVHCAYMGSTTKTIFRSESAKYFIFIQMSKEMWEFDEDGELFYEKCVYGFLPELFERWKQLGSNHVVSIVLFTRVFYNERMDTERKESFVEQDSNPYPLPYSSVTHTLTRDNSGRLYRDFYRVVVDWEIKSDWNQVLIPLRKEFMQFQRDILQQQNGDGVSTLSGENSSASEGNMLEAVNLAMNPFDKHYIDRDLMRTGLSIVIVTAGTGIFHVDKRLCRLTTQRMTDNGVALDLVCLSKPPLHTTPLFLFISKDFMHPAPLSTTNTPGNSYGTEGTVGDSVHSNGARSSLGDRIRTGPQSGGAGNNSAGAVGFRGNRFTTAVTDRLTHPMSASFMAETWDPLYFDDDSPDNPERVFFYEPAWVEVSYWNRQFTNEKCVISEPLTIGKGWEIKEQDRFINRCKMTEVQMMGIFEQVGSWMMVPYLDLFNTAESANESEPSERLYENELAKSLASPGSSIHQPVYHGNIASVPIQSMYESSDDHRGKSSNLNFPSNRISFPSHDNYTPKSLYSPSFNGDFDKYDESLFHVDMRRTTKPRSYGASSDGGNAVSYRVTDTVRSVDPELLRQLHQYSGQSGRGAVSESLEQEPEAPVVGSLGRQTLVGVPRHRGHTVEASKSKGPSALTSLFVAPSASVKKVNSGGDLESMRRASIVSAAAHADTYLMRKKELQEDLNMEIAEAAMSRISSSPVVGPIRIKSPSNQSHHQGTFKQSYRRHLLEDNGPSHPSQHARHSFSGESFKAGISPNALEIGKKSSPGRHLGSLQSRGIYAQHYHVRQNYVNPCNPGKTFVPYSSQLSRWKHVDIARSRFCLTNWKSLCTPACLPLTTDYFPQQEELAKFYQEYTYTVSPADVNPYQNEDTHEDKRVANLLIELVAQRLSQGFQLTTQSEAVDSNQEPGAIDNTKVSSTKTSYFLSLGDHVHQLCYDASGQNVEVKRYVKKILYNTDSISYNCAIWPKNMDFYTPKTLQLSYPILGSYNWNYLDHLISGYQEEMTENLRFWRARFLLIPMETVPHSNTLLNPSNENLDEEELRIAGFHKFIELFEKARLIMTFENPLSVKSKKEIGSSLPDIQLTTFNTASFVHDELQRLATTPADSSTTEEGTMRRNSIISSLLQPSASNTPPEPSLLYLTRTSPLSTIAQAMLRGNSELSFKDRRWHFKLFEKVFVGSECVEWMVRHFSDIDTREEAVLFGNELMDRGFFQHIFNKHRFLDGHYFYRLAKEYMTQKDARSAKWFRSSPSKSASAAVLDSTHAEQSHPSTVLTAPLDTKKPLLSYPGLIELSRRMVIEMDPLKKSNRREVAILHYDTVHNPRNCFHFQLHWMVCTAKLIEDMLSSWSRVAEKCGLRLVEAPIEQAKPFADDNPFQSVIVIQLCLSPPSLSQLNVPLLDIPHLWFETELVKHHGFVLDVEADKLFPQDCIRYSYKKPPYKYTQYVHRSGVAFIQILESGQGFRWVNNRLFLTSTSPGGYGIRMGSTSTSNLPHPEQLRLKFKNFCEDKQELALFWKRVTEELVSVAMVDKIPSEIPDDVAKSSLLIQRPDGVMEPNSIESSVE